MSEAVAKGDVLMEVHNLSTDWLFWKETGAKNATVFRDTELRYREVGTVLQS